MSRTESDSTPFEIVMETLASQGFDGMANAIAILFDEAMKLERDNFLGAGPYERTPGRRGRANGFKPKTVKTRVGVLNLRIPQVRDASEPFYPQAVERGGRSERALKLALSEMYIQGVSTRKVKAITKKLCGFEVSSAQVSRLTALLDAELESWRNRPVGQVPYLLLDARYKKVRHGGSVVDCGILTATGILPDGRRSVLGVSVALSEAEVHWRNFLQSLLERGMHGVQLIVSDNHLGLKEARIGTLPGTSWQRCQFHLQQNAAAYVPKVSMRKAVAADIRSVFDTPDGHEARRRLEVVAGRWRSAAPQLSDWMEAALPEGLTVFAAAPPHHRRRLRTVNLVERLNKEIRRRTRVATLFPNEASLLRLASAVLVEISEEWETGRVYLNMEPE